MPRKEQTRNYLHEDFPKKPYVRKKRIYIRDRKKFEIFFGEVIIAIFIIFMMLMLFINANSVQEYQAEEAEPEPEPEVDIEIEITEYSSLVSGIMMKSEDLYSICYF